MTDKPPPEHTPEELERLRKALVGWDGVIHIDKDVAPGRMRVIERKLYVHSAADRAKLIWLSALVRMKGGTA